MTQRAYFMPHGAQPLVDGGVRFRLYAPAHERVHIDIDGVVLPLLPFDRGWHEVITHEATVGSRYRFVLPDGTRIPDPVSRFQPQDVHGPSEVIDPRAYEWHDTDWRGLNWRDAVLYELHVGAFTAAGTFRAIIERLDYLTELGVTALQVMPVADFPGRHNWGYDGVLLFAPDSSYGRPEDFKALIDAAHQRGLMVLLDVVYNHFGPDGNYLARYAPHFFNEQQRTPWGAAINFDGEHSRPVREFMIHNALYWLEEFHLDGLRLDAVHAIVDDGEPHFVCELAERARAAITDRAVHLVLENENNQATLLQRTPRPRWFTAQWNDDVHHVLHTAVTGESQGYYSEYTGDTYKLARALAEGFALQGDQTDHRGIARGEPSAQLPPTAFISFIQNHDQIGNRVRGERLQDLTSPQQVLAVAAVYLLLPQIPMLFMGEEWAAAQPFAFFCDFNEQLAAAVRNGRREELARSPAVAAETHPDPTAAETFHAAKLQWSELAQPQHAERLDWYRRILRVRRQYIVPMLESIEQGGQFDILAAQAVRISWRGAGRELLLLANLSADAVPCAAPVGDCIWQQGYGIDRQQLQPWSVQWWLVE